MPGARLALGESDTAEALLASKSSLDPSNPGSHRSPPLAHAKAPRQEEINVETDEKVLIPRPGCGAGRRRGASPA